MPSAPLLTIPACSLRQWSATAKLRPAPSPPHGISTKCLNRVRDGVVLPILHLNGYKIANPTILARIPRDELDSLFVGYGYAPHTVEGDDPTIVHQQMAATLEHCVSEIKSIQDKARQTGSSARPRWPMIIL